MSVGRKKEDVHKSYPSSSQCPPLYWVISGCTIFAGTDLQQLERRMIQFLFLNPRRKRSGMEVMLRREYRLRKASILNASARVIQLPLDKPPSSLVWPTIDACFFGGIQILHGIIRVIEIPKVNRRLRVIWESKHTRFGLVGLSKLCENRLHLREMSFCRQPPGGRQK